MIYLYSGTPGSGKSLHQAKDIYYWLRRGNTCIANFDVDLNKIPKCKGNFIYLDNEYLTPENLIKFSKVYFHDHRFAEGKLRVYIDECQLLFNAREWQISGRKEWLSFFTQHRKYGYDIFLVAQFDRMVDRQIRSLIEYEVIHRKASNFGTVGLLAGILAGGNLFVAVTMWYPLHERIDSSFFKANKKYYQLYDTFNTFESEKKGGFLNVTNNKGSDQFDITSAIPV